MRFHILVGAATISIAGLLLSCSDDIVNTKEESPLVPLAVGNFWQYQLVEYDLLLSNPATVLDTMTLAITRSYWQEIGGKQTALYILKEYESAGEQGGWAADSSIVFNEGSSYMMIDPEGRLVPHTIMIAKYPVSQGETWNYVECYNGSCDSIGVKIVTPLGTFDCHQFVYYWDGSCPNEAPLKARALLDDGRSGDYYAPGIGRVIAGATTINGTTVRRWELIAFRAN